MAKCLPLDAKDSVPSAKTRFKFDTNNDDFEQYKQGFIAKKTADSTQKFLRLFNE